VQKPPDRTHAACMPDTAWPISGHPPDSSRDCIETPVSMSFPTSRHFLSGSLAFVFPIPTPDSFPLPFPRRSPQRSSANAARGGLTPPPTGRRRRCAPSISHTACTQKFVNSYTSTPSGMRAAQAGSPGGISPPGSHRTERDSLPSFRSSHPSFRSWASMPSGRRDSALFVEAHATTAGLS